MTAGETNRMVYPSASEKVFPLPGLNMCVKYFKRNEVLPILLGQLYHRKGKSTRKFFSADGICNALIPGIRAAIKFIERAVLQDFDYMTTGEAKQKSPPLFQVIDRDAVPVADSDNTASRCRISLNIHCSQVNQQSSVGRTLITRADDGIPRRNSGQELQAV